MIFKRATYQNGSVFKESRKSGDVWVFRWREVNAHGKKVQRKQTLGTLKKLPSLAAANKAASALRIDINKEAPHRLVKAMTMEELIAHYQLKELPDDLSQAQVPKAHSTAVAYRRYLRKWILPRWGRYEINSFAPIAVEEWLSELDLANGTKAKIRNIMSAVFNHAMRHGFLPRQEGSNPMRFVRQSSQSDVVHTVLDLEQVWSLIDELREPVRTMALLDAFTGLRISELLALKWEDIDAFEEELHVWRGIVYGVVGKCKTPSSKRPVPLHLSLAKALREHRNRSPYNQPSDWVFASPRTNGLRPFTTGSLLRWHLQPAAKRAGITGSIGWHTLRRTFASLLIANGENVKVVQESMGHSSSKMTLDRYAQSSTAAKREALGRLFTPPPVESSPAELMCNTMVQ